MMTRRVSPLSHKVHHSDINNDITDASENPTTACSVVKPSSLMGNKAATTLQLSEEETQSQSDKDKEAVRAGANCCTDTIITRRISTRCNNSMIIIPSIRSKLSPFLIQSTIMASLGGILFGYDLGVISAALPQLRDTYHLSSSQQELVVSILYLGGGIGAAIGGSVCDQFGRKRAILITDVLFLIAAMILYLAPTIQFVVVGRLIVGIAVALSGVADVAYLHEIAPLDYRGALVSVNEACIALGFLLAFAMGCIFEDQPNGWRDLFGLSGFVAVLQLLGMWHMPESPQWLKDRGRFEESMAAQRRIGIIIDHEALSTSEEVTNTKDCAEPYDVNDGSDERRSTDHAITNGLSSYHEGPAPVLLATVRKNSFSGGNIKRSHEAAMSHSEEIESPIAIPRDHSVRLPRQLDSIQVRIYEAVKLVWELLCFAWTMTIRFRKQVVVTLFMALVQQFCGQTVILSYATSILDGTAIASTSTESHSHPWLQHWSPLIIGLVKFVVTVLVIWRIERIGRRRLLLVGMATIALGLLLLILALPGRSSVIDTSEVSGNGRDNTSKGDFIVALLGVLLVVMGYSMSFGPLTWLLTSELFPTEIRGRALGASTITTYLAGGFVTYTFLSAQDQVGPRLVFLIYFTITCAGILFAGLAIPETGGKNVEEIEVELNRMNWWRPWSLCPNAHTYAPPSKENGHIYNLTAELA